LNKQWCIPPKANAEFVYRMAGTLWAPLDVYTRPHDPRYPQVCMDGGIQATAAECMREPAD